MDFEAIPLHSKNITADNIRINSESPRVAKTEKMCLEDQKRRHKIHGTCQDKRVG